jgi:predicted transcriptional regulator
LDGKGALGAVEYAVLERLWDDGPGDVKAVHRAVGRARGIASNTVQSAMERLYRKGLLRRTKIGHAYRYEAACSREQLGAELVRSVVDRVLRGRTSDALAAFVDLAARAGADELEHLERLVAAQRQRARGGE